MIIIMIITIIIIIIMIIITNAITIIIIIAMIIINANMIITITTITIMITIHKHQNHNHDYNHLEQHYNCVINSYYIFPNFANFLVNSKTKVFGKYYFTNITQYNNLNIFSLITFNCLINSSSFFIVSLLKLLKSTPQLFVKI